MLFSGLVVFGCKRDQPPYEGEAQIEMLPSPGRANPPVFRSIAAGSDFGLALDSSGKVWAWGGRSDGQTDVPDDLGRVVQIAAGDHYGVALQDDGQVRVWGGSQACDYKPPDRAVSVAADGNAAFASVLPDGTVRVSGCFADNERLTKGLRDIQAVALGQGFLVGLTRKGELVFRTSMGDGDPQGFRIPAGVKGVTKIAAGAHHVMALRLDGTVQVWGPNYEGENDVPEHLGKVSRISGGYSSSFAVLDDGTLRSWGNTKNKENAFPPGLGHVQEISSGQFTCRLALDSAGRIFAWGEHPCDQDLPR